MTDSIDNMGPGGSWQGFANSSRAMSPQLRQALLARPLDEMADWGPTQLVANKTPRAVLGRSGLIADESAYTDLGVLQKSADNIGTLPNPEGQAGQAHGESVELVRSNELEGLGNQDSVCTGQGLGHGEEVVLGSGLLLHGVSRSSKEKGLN